MCPYSGEFYMRKGAVKTLLSRGAVFEEDGQYYKVKEVTDEE
jgi:NADH dehydrogenase (ubiquinone) Fe-S protein 6